jgi:hypothetical protein
VHRASRYGVSPCPAWVSPRARILARRTGATSPRRLTCATPRSHAPILVPFGRRRRRTGERLYLEAADHPLGDRVSPRVARCGGWRGSRACRDAVRGGSRSAEARQRLWELSGCRGGKRHTPSANRRDECSWGGRGGGRTVGPGARKGAGDASALPDGQTMKER